MTLRVVEMRNEDCRSLFIHSSTFRRRISTLWMMFFVGMLTGYLTYLNNPSLSADLFLNQALFPALISISKVLLVVYAYLRPSFSRRQLHQYSQAVVVLLYSLLTVLSIVWGEELSTPILVANLLGSVFIEYTWDANYLCAVELMPTEVRATALGTCSTAARLGMILAPIVCCNCGDGTSLKLDFLIQLLQLSTVWVPSVYVIVFVLGAINLFVSYKWLDECKNADLDVVGVNRDVDVGKDTELGASLTDKK